MISEPLMRLILLAQYLIEEVVSRGSKFEPDVPPMAGGKRGRFEIGSEGNR
jgi:hypothetical protein